MGVRGLDGWCDAGEGAGDGTDGGGGEEDGGVDGGGPGSCDGDGDDGDESERRFDRSEGTTRAVLIVGLPLSTRGRCCEPIWTTAEGQIVERQTFTADVPTVASPWNT